MTIREAATAMVLLMAISGHVQSLAQPANAPSQQTGGTELPALRGTMAVPVQTEPTPDKLDRTHGEVWHRMTLRLAGSMCPACLMELEQKLRLVPGIAFVGITRDATTLRDANATAPGDGKATEAVPAKSAQAEPSESHKQTAAAVIFLDSQVISTDRLVQFFKREKYKAVDIQQSVVGVSSTK